MLHAVVMAGGSGTRFWPQSRAALPKQFLRLFGEETLLAATLSRVGDWIPPERWWVVTNKSHAEQTRRQLPVLPAGNILQEPCGRNTAPCIGLAALAVAARDPEAIMLVMPADHFVPDPSRLSPGGRTGRRDRPRSAAGPDSVRRAADVSVRELWLHRAGRGAAGTSPDKSAGPGASPRSARSPIAPQAEEFFAAGRFYLE